MATISNMPPLPGFGLPIDHDHEGNSGLRLFPSALDPKMSMDGDYSRLQAFTLRELVMLAFMNVVTDKKDWEVKVFVSSIIAKWKKELDVKNDGENAQAGNDGFEGTSQEPKATVGSGDEDQAVIGEGGVGFTEHMFEYCIDELRYKAKLFKKSGFVQVLSGDVVKSDLAIPTELQALLKAAIAPLENVPNTEQDWHPGTDEQVLDLVHPSLFPLVYGLSRILPDSTVDLEDCITMCGKGEVAPFTPRSPLARGEDGYSNRFQWLPCEVDISGDTPKILSYINNFKPKDHTDLYQVIEKIIARVIPLWNATLTSSQRDGVRPRIAYGHVSYHESAWQKFREEYGPRRHEDESKYDHWNRLIGWESDHKRRFYAQPDVRGHFLPPPKDVPEVDLRKDFANRGLQIIVKLANIHLKPEKPTYPGGTWHVEGQLNEHICASAIYYYDCENISPTHLKFRHAFDSERFQETDYRQGDNDWSRVIYGLENWEPCVQQIGGIETRQGRLITFPNILQHQVQPFRLTDPTRPGHRKILVLFLVDPNIKIISTANVPCQRLDWWREMVWESGVLGKLPVELRDKVFRDVEDFPITLDRAKVLREELMEERKKYVVGYQEENFTAFTISLCEH